MILQCSVLGSKSEETHSVHLIRQILNYALLQHLCIESCLLYSLTTILILIDDTNVIQTQWNKRFEPNTQTKCESLSQEGLHTHNSITAWKVIPRLKLKDSIETRTNQTRFWVFLQLWRGTGPDGRLFRTDNKAASVSQCNTVPVDTTGCVFMLRTPTLSTHTHNGRGGHKARPQQELVNKSYGGPGGSWPWSAEGPDMRGGGQRS